MSDEGLVKRLRNTTIAIQPVFPTLRHEAADAIERLTRERDEAREAASVLRVVSDGTVARLEEVEEERNAAEAKVASLREVLKPFVEAYENTIAGDDDKWRDKDSLWESAAAMALCAGDLRRARSALQETEQ